MNIFVYLHAHIIFVFAAWCVRILFVHLAEHQQPEQWDAGTQTVQAADDAIQFCEGFHFRKHIKIREHGGEVHGKRNSVGKQTGTIRSLIILPQFIAGG